MRGNLGVLVPGHVLFFYQKIFVFKFIEISGFSTICYSLKLLQISVVLKMQKKKILLPFYKTHSYSIVLSLSK
jgi:hypothetical protein